MQRTTSLIKLSKFHESMKDIVYNTAMKAKLNELDHTFALIRLYAEEKLSKLMSHPWSPALWEAKRNVRYWQLWHSELQLGRDFSPLRLKIHQDQLIQDTMDCGDKRTSIGSPGISEGNYASQNFAKLTIRQEGKWRESRVPTPQKGANTRIIRAEEQRATLINLRTIKGALSRIIVEENEINDLLLTRNEKHFSQADGTPFKVSPLPQQLGKYETSQFSMKSSEQNFRRVAQTNSVYTRISTRTFGSDTRRGKSSHHLGSRQDFVSVVKQNQRQRSAAAFETSIFTQI